MRASVHIGAPMFFALFACADPLTEAPGKGATPIDTSPSDTNPTDPAIDDARIVLPAAPADGLQIVVPDQIIEPYTEQFGCYYGTWPDDSGVVGLSMHLPQPFGHSARIVAVDADSPPDGTMSTCLSAGSTLIPTVLEADGVGTELLPMPEGVAFRVAAGQRWAVETHWVNTSGQRLMVNAAINLRVVASDEVEAWADRVTLTPPEAQLLPGSDAEVSLDCTANETFNLLMLEAEIAPAEGSLGVEHVLADGSVTAVAELNHRTMVSFGEGDVVLAAGEALRTRCAWNNAETWIETGACGVSGLGWPLDAPWVCGG